MDTTTKTPFNEHTLNHFKRLLLRNREKAKDEFDRIEEVIANLRDSEDADRSSAAHHMGDMGTDVEEEEMNYQLYERTRRYINQIDSALERIENKTYGICQATGNPIAMERLEIVPHTRYSVEAKKQGLVKDQ